MKLNVNGEAFDINVDAGEPLLYVLRDRLGFAGPRFGCGLGQCGACAVHVDGRPVRACVITAEAVQSSEITTLEGLGTADNPHPLQSAFIELQAMQCGFCSNGMIMTAAALLAENENPSDTDIRRALDGNLCRCGTHTRILKAVKLAAEAGNE